MAIKTFSPSRNPSYDVVEQGELPVTSYSSIKGYDQRRPLGLWERRIFQLSWVSLAEDELNEIISFFSTLKDADGDYAAGEAFYWTPIRAVESPTGDEPKLEQVSGGSLSGRTYYVKYTWYNSSSTQETKASGTSSLAISANYLCKVTAPVFPNGVDRVRIYASETQGSEKLETTSSSRTWTEPVTGLVGTGGTAPTSNNLKPAIKFVLASAIPRPQFVAGRWRLGPINFEEQWI